MIFNIITFYFYFKILFSPFFYDVHLSSYNCLPCYVDMLYFMLDFMYLGKHLLNVLLLLLIKSFFPFYYKPDIKSRASNRIHHFRHWADIFLGVLINVGRLHLSHLD